MNRVYLEEINTDLDAFEIYKIFYEDRYSIFLDSGMDRERLGKYSFISANPFLEIESKNDQIIIRENGREMLYQGNPFIHLKENLSKYHIKNDTNLPFVGGAVGFLSYDLCHHLEKLPLTVEDDLNLPDFIIGFYDGIVIFDHNNNKVYVASAGFPEEKAAQNKINEIKRRIEKNKKIDLQHLDFKYSHNKPRLISNFTQKEYYRAIEKVRKYILQGDIYQMNMTQRFSTLINKHPLNIYDRLRTINPAPFASYLNYGDMQVISSSPERFLQLRDGTIETRPIKGTLPRGKNSKQDERNKRKLLKSKKDRAENLMIVDLLRNDIGRVCKFGSIRVPELFCLETYPTVFHLVSTVTGKLREDQDAVDCIMATFPGGSITGAPKIRSMEIIDELEPTCRHVYTGSIGYIGFDGNMDLNIVIRTILIKNDQAYYQVGGAIVWDSVPEKEYQETLDKGLALRKALL